jgi:glycosyltransferase involved in cell wall biosynthesis
MLNGKTVAVVVPAYNEETQIGIVIETMPTFVDRIVIVNDKSPDATADVVMEYIKNDTHPIINIKKNPTEIASTFFNRAEIVKNEILTEELKFFPKHEVFNENETSRIVLINNLENAKVGGAISVGYLWCRNHSIDCTAVMDGDAQMDPDELESLCSPIVFSELDYVKGNRLSHKAAIRMIPRKRYFGNSVLSALTKVASGYWRISDTQTGYTAISLDSLYKIDIHKIYRSYGLRNDILIKLNVAKCTIKEIPIKPVYSVGEQSKMKIGKVIPTVAALLVRGFFYRIVKKYLIIDFHPIFIFYFISFLSGILGLGFLVDIIHNLLTTDDVSMGTYFAFVLLIVTSFLTLGFAMWFDVYDNDELQK